MIQLISACLGEGKKKSGDTYNQVADDNLENLGPQAGAPAEGLLQKPNQEVAQGGADEGAICRHLGDSRGEIVAVLVAILGEPRGHELLGTRESTSREHLGPQRVLLKLPEVSLEAQKHRSLALVATQTHTYTQTQRAFGRSPGVSTYRQITLGSSILPPAGEGSTDHGGDGVVAFGAGELARRGLSYGGGRVADKTHVLGSDIFGDIFGDISNI